MSSQWRMVKHVVPLQFMEEYSRNIHAAVCQGTCNPWSIHAGAGSQGKLWPVQNPCWTCQFFKVLHPMDRTHSGTVLQELQPMGRANVGDVCRGLDLVGGKPCQSMGKL